MTHAEGNICKCFNFPGQLVSSLWFPFNCNSLAIQLVTFLQFSFNCNSLTIQLNCSSLSYSSISARQLKNFLYSQFYHDSIFCSFHFTNFVPFAIPCGKLGLPTCEKRAQIPPCNHMESIIFTLSPQPVL